MPYQLPALTTKLYPTVQEAFTALKAADSDDPAARDVRPLMSILMRIASAQPRMKGHILTRRVAVSAFDWVLKPADTAFQDAATAAQMRLQDTADALLDWHTSTPLFGAMAVELNWDTKAPGGTTPQIVKRYKPVEVEAPTDNARDINVLLDAPDLQRRPVAGDSPEQWVVDQDDSFERGGLLRSLMFNEILGNDNLQEWANFLTLLKGLVTAQWETWAGKQDRATAVQALKDLATRKFAATSKGIEFGFHELVDAMAGTAFKDFKHEVETDRSITILGQANTSELPQNGGSRAALQILNLIRADIYYSDMRRMERVINRQLVLHDYRLNHDKAALTTPWKFRFIVSQELDPEKKVRIISDLKESGYALITDEAYEYIEFTRPEGLPDIIAGDTATTGLPKVPA